MFPFTFTCNPLYPSSLWRFIIKSYPMKLNISSEESIESSFREEAVTTLSGNSQRNFVGQLVWQIECQWKTGLCAIFQGAYLIWFFQVSVELTYDCGQSVKIAFPNCQYKVFNESFNHELVELFIGTINRTVGRLLLQILLFTIEILANYDYQPVFMDSYLGALLSPL